jgi:hypothetical protein
MTAGKEEVLQYLITEPQDLTVVNVISLGSNVKR